MLTIEGVSLDTTLASATTATELERPSSSTFDGALQQPNPTTTSFDIDSASVTARKFLAGRRLRSILTLQQRADSTYLRNELYTPAA